MDTCQCSRSPEFPEQGKRKPQGGKTLWSRSRENSLEGPRDPYTRLGLKGETTIPEKGSWEGKKKQGSCTKDKDFSADSKTWESGTINKTQNYKLQKARKPLCPAPSDAPHHAAHIPYCSMSSCSLISSQSPALITYSSSYPVDFERIYGKRCYASVSDTRPKSTGLQFLDHL